MSWEPLNLATLGNRPQVTPSLGNVGLVYPGRRHVFSGPPESAKTLAAYCVAINAIRAGSRVVLIDLEMGPWDARDRLRDLGAIDEDLAALSYVDPDTAADEATIGELIALKPALVIIDAAAGAYDLQRLDDNRRQDVEEFARVFVRAFWVNGIATILLDHVTKSAEARGKFAIGSERKVGGADVHLGFEAITPLRRGGRGLYKIATHKDRLGHLARPHAAELELVSDPDTHAIAWAFQAAPASPASPDGSFRPTILMDRVLEYLAAYPEPVTRNALANSVTGKREYVLKAIDLLLSEGQLASDGRKLTRNVPVPRNVPGNAPEEERSRVPLSTDGNGNAHLIGAS